MKKPQMRPVFSRVLFATLCALALVQPATAGAADDAAAPKELNLFAWSEYIPTSVIEGFEKESGIKVNYEEYGSNEEMLIKLVSGASKYDLIQPSEYTIEALIKENQLLPLDKSRLPNMKNLDGWYAKQAYDPGLKYSVPYMSGTVGIVVNKEKVKEPVTGYDEVFQEKYKGRIVVLDDAVEIVTWAMATQGKGPAEVSSETVAATRPVLERWLPMVKVYDSDSPKTALLNGDVDIGIVWSGEGAILVKEDSAKFQYVLPKEGAHMFIDSFAIPKNAPNPAAALAFINYILQPAVSKEISKEFPYTNPNLEARKLLTEQEQGNEASYPKGSPKLEIFRDMGPTAVEIDELFTDVKAKSAS